MGIPPMRVSLEFTLGAVCKERGLLRSQFDALGEDEQIDLVAQYLAEQQLQRWGNYRDAKRMANMTQGR